MYFVSLEGIEIIDPIAKLLGSWSSEMNFWTILIRIVLSFIFAAALGYERANKRHAAGFRTFILVSLSSTIAVMIDVFFVETYGFSFPLLSAAVLISIAILSSNSILFSSRNQIKGLTTSVALWATAILGLSIGAGFYTVSIIYMILLALSLSILPKIEIYLKNKSNHFEIHLELKNKSNLQDFVATLRKLNITIDDIESNPAYNNSGLSVYTVSLSVYSKELKKYKRHSEIIEALNTLDYVNYIGEIN